MIWTSLGPSFFSQGGFSLLVGWGSSWTRGSVVAHKIRWNLDFGVGDRVGDPGPVSCSFMVLFQAHHLVPHAKGGTTTVGNGALLHLDQLPCSSARSAPPRRKRRRKRRRSHISRRATAEHALLLCLMMTTSTGARRLDLLEPRRKRGWSRATRESNS